MESLRKEIEQEMKRTRLDKARLYDLLLKIIDNGGSGGAGPQCPAGPAGVKGPAGPAGPAGECDAKAPAPAPVAKAPETAPVADAKAPPKTATVTKKVLVKKKVVTA